MNREDFEYRERAYQEDLARLKTQIDQEMAAEFEQERQKVERDNVSATVKDGTLPIHRTHERREKDAENTQSVFDQRRQDLEARETARRNELLRERQERLELQHFEELGRRKQLLDAFEKKDRMKRQLLAQVEKPNSNKGLEQPSEINKPETQQEASVESKPSAEEIKQRKIYQIKQEFLDKTKNKDRDQSDDYNR